MRTNKKLIDMCFIALMAAVICICGPISFAIPVSPVPISLATFAVYLTSALLGMKKGSLSVLIYILLGVFGLPVFSGAQGGFAKIAGPTGGYIIGYIFIAIVVGLFTDKFEKKLWVYPVAMIAGTAVCYALGTSWFMCVTHNDLLASLTMCVTPYIPLDIIKIVVASAVAYPVRVNALNKLSRQY